MLRRYVAVLAALVLAGLPGAIAQAATQPANRAADRDLGERLIEGLATDRFLWVRNSAGGVVRFDLASGARLKSSRTLVDIALWRGRPVGLSAEDGKGRYVLIDLDSGQPLAPALTLDLGPGRQTVTLVAGEGLAVLTQDRLWVLDKGWISRRLSEPLGHGRIVTAWHPRQGILVGRNQGEWCGSLRWIDPATGQLATVRRQADQREPGCEAVTALAPDREQPDCLLAAVGLSHFMADGGVLRVCGNRSSVIFRRAVPVPTAAGAGDDEQAAPLFDDFWPIFDLTASGDGWAAISQGRLFRASKGVVTDEALPPLTDWHGLPAAFVGEDLIMLKTDANAAFSLSGDTPLLVARP
ncbi:MAG: hypothetical protein EON95_08090 [Caulobacteraceae bacterium]|nr:MAG: hypothetical protein EON95_08090 [Caulobacteraceae bacterium]